MRPGVHGRHGRWSPGGILTYAADDLFAEIAYVAQVYPWPLSTLLDLEHPDRHRLIELARAEHPETDPP